MLRYCILLAGGKLMLSWDNWTLLVSGTTTLLQSVVTIVAMVRERKQR